MIKRWQSEFRWILERRNTLLPGPVRHCREHGKIDRILVESEGSFSQYALLRSRGDQDSPEGGSRGLCAYLRMCDWIAYQINAPTCHGHHT